MSKQNLKKITCLSKKLTDGEVIALVKGLKGFIPTDYGQKSDEWVNQFNKEQFNVNEDERLAYEIASLSGDWNNIEDVTNFLNNSK